MFHPFTLKLGGELRTYFRPQVMGILNVTPDSFYGGSRSMNERDLSARIEGMIKDGADIIDVGAYSSRPGAADVPEEEEIARLRLGLSVLRAIDGTIPVSVDTFRANVAKVAVLELGADIVNDISGCSLDPGMAGTVAELKVPYVLMHMRGNPATMQQHTDYKDVTAEVISDLSVKLRRLRLMGVSDVIIDPGFGFSKTLDQNFDMMKNLGAFSTLGCPLLVGISRKSMLSRSLDIETDEALAATVALDAMAMTKGASIIRVHDVKEAAQSAALFAKTDC